MLRIVFQKQFLFFRHGSANVKIFLFYGIYYTHALAIYGHIFPSKYRFILNLLHSLIRFFMKKMSAIRKRVCPELDLNKLVLHISLFAKGIDAETIGVEYHMIFCITLFYLKA